MNKTVRGFTEEAAELLTSNQWKGNIRELENTVHRSVLIAKSDLVGSDDFMLEGNAHFSNPVNGSLKEMEMDLIYRTLEETNGNKTRAARILGVSVRTIRNKLQEHGKNFPAV
jgi:two-component system response regulator FlrC